MLGRKVLQVSRELRDERCGVCALLLQCGELLVGAGKVLGKDGPYKAADCFLACQAQAALDACGVKASQSLTPTSKL